MVLVIFCGKVNTHCICQYLWEEGVGIIDAYNNEYCAIQSNSKLKTLK